MIRPRRNNMGHGVVKAGWRFLLVLGGIGLIGSILLICRLTKDSERQAFGGLDAELERQRTRATLAPTTLPEEEAWRSSSLAGVTVDAPVAFHPLDVWSLLAPATKKLIEDHAAFSGESRLVTCTVTRYTYKKGVRVDLDAGVAGAMNRSAAAGGDSTSNYTSTPAAVDGIPARRAIHKGRKVWTEGLFLCNEQTMWVIQVVHDGNSGHIADRIFRSIHVARGETQ